VRIGISPEAGRPCNAYVQWLRQSMGNQFQPTTYSGILPPQSKAGLPQGKKGGLRYMLQGTVNWSSGDKGYGYEIAEKLGFAVEVQCP
jgi:hypothetical protein